ncbi:uncharacterized protein TNCV_4869241 [Trichonephila clavipes]|nr:uncharacterized protein TNCV_4869241 [Trichonephila clavipes]
MEAKHVNEFRPNDVMWEKTSKGLLRNPDRLLKNTDKRMVYIYNNIFFAKKDFTFGLRTVKSGEIHLIQTTHVPMLIYEFPASSLKCRAQPNLIQKGFHVADFRKMKNFNQTPYKLPPPTPIHVPAEKRPLEEKALPKKRVRITPVMRRVSRRSELPMAPVQIPDVLEPVPIQMSHQPVPISDVLEPVPIPDVPPSPVHIPQPPV